MRITNKQELKKLEFRINEAKRLRRMGFPFKIIGNQIGTSPTMAHKYVVEGDEILERNKLKESNKPRWERIAGRLFTLYNQPTVSEKTFSLFFDMWCREERSPKFKNYIVNFFHKKGVEL